MTRKSISLLLSMLIVAICVMTPFAASAETSVETDITFSEVTFSTGGVEIVGKAIPGTTEITASVKAKNEKGSGEKFTLLIAVYDKDNRLLKVAANPELQPTTAEQTFTVMVNGFVADEDTKAKVFFMDSLSVLRPLGDTEDISFGFPTANKYYISINTDETLDATTLKKENFTLTQGGVEVPVIKEVCYFPIQGEVRIYLTDEIENYDSASQFSITSSGVKDVENNAVSLTAQAYFTPESKCDLYDLTVANLKFKAGGATLYTQPKEGDCDITVRVVNAALESKSGTLKVYAKNLAGEIRSIAEAAVSLSSGAEKEYYYQATITSGEVIYAEIVK